MTNILLYDTGDVRGELNEPVGIELIAANLLKRLNKYVSVDVKWFNFDSYSFDILQYDIIGISIHINGMEVFDYMYRFCRESGFKGLIVAGNSIATFAWKELLDSYPDILCMIGEGENAWTELVKEYQKEQPDYSYVPNLAYLEQGRLILTPREVCNMQDYLPPLRVFSQQLKRCHGIARIEASRGCSWNQCSFCGADHKYNHTGWRPIPTETILKQLSELSQAGLTTIYFCDEDFIGNDYARFSSLVDQIHEKMKRREISSDMRFFISVKPADLLKQSTLKTIRHFMACGLKELFVGLESGCAAQLKRYNKCTTVKTNSLAVNRIRELEKDGLSIDIGFIFFDYDMTPGDIEENIRFIETHRLYSLASSLIKPLRIQPYTKVFACTSAVHASKLLTDELMYPYHFVNGTVEQVWKTYSELELETIAHKLQSVYRRELSSNAQRKTAERNLAELRVLQFSALRMIVMCTIHQEIDETQLKNHLDTILSQADHLLQKTSFPQNNCPDNS